MKLKNAKLIFIVAIALFLFFFSNDFGIIDIEKTAIITAIAIDYKDNQEDVYNITAQIAVPKANDKNMENKQAHVSGSGKTIGAAIKNIGDLSGWFPNLTFCNLIILGSSLTSDNIMHVLDYFSRTLRVQESAIVALAENMASEILLTSSPFDNISSFAIQKIILKNPGFDNDVANNDIKNFTTGYYSEGKSSFLPIIKLVKSQTSSQEETTNQGEQQNIQGGQSSSSPEGEQSGEQTSNNGKSFEKSNILYDVKSTALFKNGYLVGEMQPKQTLTFNMLTQPFNGTTLEIDDVEIANGHSSYLLTCFRCTPSIKMVANKNDLSVKINLSLYCKISDQTNVGADDEFHKNNQLPKEVISRAEEDIKASIEDLIQLEKRTGCDFLNLKQKLYRYNYKQYSRYKDNYLSVMNVEVKVKISGQK